MRRIAVTPSRRIKPPVTRAFTRSDELAARAAIIAALSRTPRRASRFVQEYAR